VLALVIEDIGYAFAYENRRLVIVDYLAPPQFPSHRARDADPDALSAVAIRLPRVLWVVDSVYRDHDAKVLPRCQECAVEFGSVQAGGAVGFSRRQFARTPAGDELRASRPGSDCDASSARWRLK
jgi:hypothetical protein